MDIKLLRGVSISIILVLLLVLISIPCIVAVEKANRLHNNINEIKANLEKTNKELIEERKSKDALEEVLFEKLQQIDNLTERLSVSDRMNKPIDRKVITSRGTKREYVVTNKILDNSEVLGMRATAYDLSEFSCGKDSKHPEYGITRSGERVIYRTTVAVDPRVIPLGSILYVKFPKTYSYLDGIYKAMDTGSAVKNDIIDIYVGEYEPKLCDNFGIQKVKVYIIG